MIEKQLLMYYPKHKMTNPIPTDWKQVKASKIIDVRDGTHDSPKRVELGGIPLLTSKNIVNGELSFHSFYCISEEDAEQANKRSSVQKGDILISMIGTVGESALIKDEPNFVIKNVGLFRKSEENILPQFLIKQLHSQKLKGIIKSFLNGGIQKFIGLGDLRKLPLILPPLPEQHRIVSVLETWDKALEKLTRKIKLKKNIKKGLMQELLTGKRRLSGFSGEWNKVKLGEIGNTFAGLTGKTKEDFGDGAPYISYMNIFSNLRIPKELSERVMLVEGEKQQEVKYGDMFFTTSSETPEEVGVCSILLYQPKEPTYLNSFCFGLRPNNFEILLPEFAQFYFNSRVFRKKMARLAQGASRFNLSKKHFVDTSIEIPESKEEQTAIAKILTTAHNEITALEKKKQILENQKKYLLNNLITGQIRTPENLTMNNHAS